jgi:DNA-binding MarR family transcriptional regulator
VTRQIRELEEQEYVRVGEDPADRRSLRVTITDAGAQELRRLVDFGLKRFALFVRDSDPEELRAFTELLWKLQTSMATISARERRPTADRRRGGASGLPSSTT